VNQLSNNYGLAKIHTYGIFQLSELISVITLFTTMNVEINQCRPAISCIFERVSFSSLSVLN